MDKNLEKKVSEFITKYCTEFGMDDLDNDSLTERFLETYGSEYLKAGNAFLEKWLNTKFVDDY